MSETTSTTKKVERHPNGKIPATQRYIDYDGQLVIRTRYATIQRFKESGWDNRRKGAPYILHSDYCRESDTLGPKNEHLDANEFTVSYVDGETVKFEVVGDGS
ncbi:MULTISPECIES: hypothetical protein [Halobacterium]|uniref:hypothetical protein n=1 Tax=Halobacterium TaxID=2239 RepID=UPI00073E78C0|nr:MULTISPECIES: hypothetical protein [Halobacterium]MCG1002882.1 hypothetical protein [Halobacterium noricense]